LSAALVEHLILASSASRAGLTRQFVTQKNSCPEEWDSRTLSCRCHASRTRKWSQPSVDNNETTRALLIEDDPGIADLIRCNLTARNYVTTVSPDGLRALRLLATKSPDIVLLDLTLPDIDGFELCRQIYEQSPVAIIVVSARDGLEDKVRALHIGADDYITKPFSIEELLARINATLRRTRTARPTNTRARHEVIIVGDLRIDMCNQQVSRAGQTVHLTPTEFALLRELAVHQGKLLSRAHLLRRVWGASYETETEYLRVYVRRLRAKLETDDTRLIVTEPGGGYWIQPAEPIRQAGD
jgi:two-component system KDP operon response regulator KdpE